MSPNEFFRRFQTWVIGDRAPQKTIDPPSPGPSVIFHEVSSHQHVFGPNGCWCGAKKTEQQLIQELDAALIGKHRALIDKFLEIAERKVAVIDDYGDENWEALDKEIERCVVKIATIEGEQAFHTKNGERIFTALGLPTPMHMPGTGQNCGWLMGIPVKVNIDSGGKPNGVPERR